MMSRHLLKYKVWLNFNPIVNRQGLLLGLGFRVRVRGGTFINNAAGALVARTTVVGINMF